MATEPFTLDPVLTAIAIGYRNDAYSADILCPRSQVADQKFRYAAYPAHESYQPVESRVGRLSQPNTVTVSGQEQASFTEDYGLDGPIPNLDLERDSDAHDIKGRTVERIAEALALNREQRVAALYADEANYAAGLTLTLSGKDKLSDPACDPLAVLLDSLDKPLMRPNTLVMGQDVWTKVRRHAKLVKAVRNDSGEGAISTQNLSELLEIQRVVIGRSRVNAVRPGKPARLERVWGNNIALVYLDPSASFAAGGITFALTAQWGERIAGEYDVPSVGMRGAVVVRAGESLREIALAPHAGFLIQGVL